MKIVQSSLIETKLVKLPVLLIEAPAEPVPAPHSGQAAGPVPGDNNQVRYHALQVTLVMNTLIPLTMVITIV